MSTLSFEVNLEGLPGPTHFYGGLALGNKASMAHQGVLSNPRLAALQTLEKLKFIHGLGIKQIILPPQERPHLPTLKKLGFLGSNETILEEVKQKAPWLLELCCSSSGMWSANGATVSPSVDCVDNHVHFTPANLASLFHRSIESTDTAKVLKVIFDNSVLFAHHDPLPSVELFADEGAANHTRFCKAYNGPGVELFVYGKSFYEKQPGITFPEKFPARQTLEASQAIARLHELYENHFVFAQQNPSAIDAGVFHNDVISVGNQNVFLYHEEAFVRSEELIQTLSSKVQRICDVKLNAVEIKSSEVSIEDALNSYFFNSQLLTLPDGSMTLIAPIECQRHLRISQFLKEFTDRADHPIGSIHYFDLNQSMQNGGGPACLRLRVVLNENEIQATKQEAFFSNQLYEELILWVNKYYPIALRKEDLSNPKIYEKNCQALDELTGLLNLGKVYSFQ